MHILFLTHYFTPENNAPAARVHGMAKEWARSGHRVTVLTCAPNVPAGVVYEGYENKLYQEEWIDGIRTVRVWTWLAANRGRVRRGLNYLSYLAAAGAAGPLLRPRADVVIATSPQFFAGWAGWPVARAHGAPFVLEVRDIWPDSIVAVGALEQGRVIRALGKLERALYDGADHIVAVGDGYRMNMIRKGIGPSRISVVTNGVDVDLFEPREPDQELRARLGFSPETFVVTFAGTIGMASGLEVALGAARRLKDKGRDDIAFLLIGDGAVRAELEERARAEGLDQRRLHRPGPARRAAGLPGEQRRLPRPLPQGRPLRHHPAEQVLRGRRHGAAHPARASRATPGRCSRRPTAASPSSRPTTRRWRRRPKRLAAAPPRSGGGSARTAAATCWSTSTAASSRTTTSRSSSACAPTTGEAAGERPERLRRRARRKPAAPPFRLR